MTIKKKLTLILSFLFLTNLPLEGLAKKEHSSQKTQPLDAKKIVYIVEGCAFLLTGLGLAARSWFAPPPYNIPYSICAIICGHLADKKFKKAKNLKKSQE